MSSINKTIWLLESRLFEAVSLDDVASHAGVSRFHISRAFPAVTGWSITGYTRARRLTEAARLLAKGAPDILSVALEAGYGSHEAFTRAFRDQFGITPEKVRKQRSLDSLKLVEPLPMDDNRNIHLDAPVIEDHPAMLLAGIKRHQRMSVPNTLPLQWQQFVQHLGHIPEEVQGTTYGVIGNVADDGDEYDYYTAIEVGREGELPQDFMVLRIPPQRFARFQHRGHISTIRATIGAIFDKWPLFPGTTSEGSFGFIEHYGPKFDASRGEGDIEIWIAVEK